MSSLAIQFVPSLLIGVAVFSAATVLVRTLRRGWQRARERSAALVQVEAQDLVLVLDRASLIAIAGGTGLLVGLAGGLLGGLRLALFAAAMGMVLPPWWIVRLRRRWLQRLEAQLPDALDALAAAMRTGLSLPQAIEQIAQELAPPLQREFALVSRELKLGLGLDQALAKLSARVGSRDLDLAIAAIGIARQLGGNLSERLGVIAGTIRERLRIEGKLQALTAQGRMQAKVVAGLPILLGLAMAWMRPDLMEPMLDSPFGWGLLAVIAFLEVTGLLIIRKIVEVDV